MSPAPSPSPTHALAQNTVKASKKIVSQAHYGPKSTIPTRPLSGSLSNLNLSTSRKWNSTNDFKDQSPLSNIRYLFFQLYRASNSSRPNFVKLQHCLLMSFFMMWSTNLGNFFRHIKHIGTFIKSGVLVGNSFWQYLCKTEFLSLSDSTKELPKMPTLKQFGIVFLIFMMIFMQNKYLWVLIFEQVCNLFFFYLNGEWKRRFSFFINLVKNFFHL